MSKRQKTFYSASPHSKMLISVQNKKMEFFIEEQQNPASAFVLENNDVDQLLDIIFDFKKYDLGEDFF